MRIIKANREDLQGILNLQYLAYQSEAVLYNNFNILPLMGGDLKFIYLCKNVN
jgi:hypothetical protein